MRRKFFYTDSCASFNKYSVLISLLFPLDLRQELLTDATYRENVRKFSRKTATITRPSLAKYSSARQFAARRW